MKISTVLKSSLTRHTGFRVDEFAVTVIVANGTKHAATRKIDLNAKNDLREHASHCAISRIPSPPVILGLERQRSLTLLEPNLPALLFLHTQPKCDYGNMTMRSRR